MTARILLRRPLETAHTVVQQGVRWRLRLLVGHTVTDRLLWPSPWFTRRRRLLGTFSYMGGVVYGSPFTLLILLLLLTTDAVRQPRRPRPRTWKPPAQASDPPWDHECLMWGYGRRGDA